MNAFAYAHACRLRATPVRPDPGHNAWSAGQTRLVSFLALALALILAGLGQSASAQIPLIPSDAPWRYFDHGSDPGPQWRQPRFDDREWSIGSGHFGYGDGDETTVVNAGRDPLNPFITTYFRHVFPRPNLPPGMALELRLRRDDGVIVYLNGAEIYREYLPVNPPVDPTTRAVQEAEDDGAVTYSIPVDPTLLSTGENVLAVEIHQAASPEPPDLSFEATLLLVPVSPPLFELHPQCLTAFLGTNVQFFAFAVGATSLQWLHNDVPVPGATSPVLILTNLQRHHAGEYRLRAANAAGTVLSEAGQLQLELDTDGVIRSDLIARDFLSLSGGGPAGGPAAGFAAAGGPSGCQPPVFSLTHGSGYSYSTHGASAAAGETNHCGVVGGHSMWSTFFATASERVVLRTDGSDFDTVLAVYTWDGDDRHPLVLVACDDNSGPGGTSRVEFMAVAGTLYYVVVDGVNGATGNVRLQIGGLQLDRPAIAAGGSVHVGMSGRRTQDRTYTLRVAPSPAAATNEWRTVMATNVSRTLVNWTFVYSTNLPVGTPELFFHGQEAP